ncbi:MAG: hypothetical protein HY548_04985, partial [Elusimicrobia bacterium]|nr:hypothetical protein [Elusimicrobiota bacterium]
IKLIPSNKSKVEVVWAKAPEPQSVLEDKLTFSVSIKGRDVHSAWVEFSTDTKTWKKDGSSLSGAPYTFTVKRDRLPEGQVFLRAAAADIWENKGTTSPVPIVVAAPPPPPPPQKK